MSLPHLPRLVWVAALWAAAPAAAWAGTAAKVFPLAAAKAMPARLDGTPERLTDVVAKLVGASVSDSTIDGAALAAGCSIDDSSCLDQIARASRVQELVFGTIRVGDDQRVFVKLTRYIVSTERREKTFVLTSATPQALARQLARSAREMFDVEAAAAGKDGDLPADEAPARPRRRAPKEGAIAELGGEPADELEAQVRASRKAPRKAPRRDADELDEDAPGDGPAAGAVRDAPADAPADAPGPRRGRVTTGTYLLIAGGVMTMAAGTGFTIGAHALRDDALNAKKTTPDDVTRLAAINRAIRIRSTTGTILLVSGGLATAGGIVRAILQRRPVETERAVAIVPVTGGAAVVFSGRLP
jgi:hypothetical protein